MSSFADIKIRFAADLKQFSTQMQNVQRDMDRYGKNLQSIGTKMSLAITAPLAGLAAVSLKNYDTQAKALAQLEQGLKSTGNVVGFTFEQLQKQASDFQNSTLFGDEKIIQDVQAQLLTFTSITGENFKRTTQAALDLATRLDGDLKGSAIQLGKALNDPIANLSALSRSGIQFSKEQKALINSLVETGQVAQAQSIILDELERQYGGSAKAAAAAGLGPLTQLKNILGDITEEFGKIILDYLTPIIAKARELALRFQELSPTTKKFIVILGGVAAAAGPLLALAGTILPAIGTGLTLLTGPIGLVVAGLTAIGVAIYKHWEPIKETLVEIANYFIDLYNESTVFRVGVELIRTNFENLYDTASFVISAIGKIFTATVEQMKAGFRPLGELIRAVLTGDLEQIPVILTAAFKQGFSNAKDLVGDLRADFEALQGDIQTNISEGVDRALQGKKYEYITLGVAEAVKKGVETGIVGATPTAGGTGAGRNIPVGPIIPEGAFDVQNPLAGPTGPDFAPVIADPDRELSQFEKRLEDFKNTSAEILAGTAEEFAVGFGEIIAGIATGTAGLGDVAALLLNTMADLAKQLGRAAIQIGLTMEGLQKAFASPGIAIAAGIALVAFGALLKNVAKSFAGNFSTGGIVGGTSFAGDRLIAGVNSGELILNIAQQKNLAAALSAGKTVVLQPSISYDARGFKVMLEQVDNRNRRTT